MENINAVKEMSVELRKQAEKKLTSAATATVNISNINIHAIVHELEVQKIELEMQNDELRKTQQMLEKSNQNYVEFYEFAPTGLLSIKRNGEIVNANLTASELLCLERESLLNTKIYQYIDKNDSDMLYFYLTSVFETKTRQIIELKFHGKNGHTFYAKLESIVSEDGEGNIQHCKTAINEITKLKETEIALRKSESEKSMILNNTSELILYQDTLHNIIWVNKAVEKLVNVEPNALLGRRCHEIWHPNSSSCLNCPVEKSIKTGTPREGEITSPDGRIWFIKGDPVHNEKGDLIGAVEVALDITQQKQLENEQFKTEKLESLGILAGGIAHDFNNILTGILGNISLAKITTNPDNEQYDFLKRSEQAALRAKDLTQQLLTFSRGGVPIKETVSINKLIKDAATFSVSGSNVRCKFSISENLYPVDVDVGQLNQVINNIVLNAVHAMPAGGNIKITARNCHSNEDEKLPKQNEEYIVISFEDQGVGISEKNIAKIFDPYFTTKQKGSGLGLATSHSIINNHNGLITVKSELEKGTTINIYLPASQHQIDKNISQNKEIIAGNGRILVMDDEEDVRTVAKKMLGFAGYNVELAKNGTEAIELYKKANTSNKKFDLIVMDLTIPVGMGGKEAIQKLIKIDPDVKAIVSSGYSNNPVMANYKQFGFCGVIAKPYKIEQLSEVISKVINT